MLHYPGRVVSLYSSVEGIAVATGAEADKVEVAPTINVSSSSVWLPIMAAAPGDEDVLRSVMLLEEEEEEDEEEDDDVVDDDDLTAEVLTNESMLFAVGGP